MKSQFLLKRLPGSFDPPPFKRQGGEEKPDLTRLRRCLKVTHFCPGRSLYANSVL